MHSAEVIKVLKTLIASKSLIVLTALVMHGECNHLHFMLMKSSHQMFYLYANPYNQANYVWAAHLPSFAGWPVRAATLIAAEAVMCFSDWESHMGNVVF